MQIIRDPEFSIRLIIQPELISSLIITAILCVVFVFAGRQIKKADPLEKPKGIVLVCEIVVTMFQNFFHTILPNQELERRYIPYFSMLGIYLFISNISGLFCLESPTSNYSITLTLALITFVFVQTTAFKTKGKKRYLIDLVWPPTNILSMISPVISLSMRIFGNIVSGSILMALVYSATATFSNMLFSFIPINVVGPIVAPVLHAYFDIFSGFLQTFIFITLSSVYITMEA